MVIVRRKLPWWQWGLFSPTLPKQALPKALSRRLVHPGGNALNELGELLHLHMHMQVAGAGHSLARGFGLADLTLRKAAHVVVEVLPQVFAGPLGGFLNNGLG